MQKPGYRNQGADTRVQIPGCRGLYSAQTGRLSALKTHTRISSPSEAMKLEYQRSELLIQVCISLEKVQFSSNSYKITYFTEVRMIPFSNESFNV